ncbi:NUDIX hydrolase [Paenibacillus sp. 1001270B_150601_E10]|uniref:NUDIX hydrolase n=1 Tax=Paenibacillus sp. 1001270B_150601_E10 TaxID=2787079 RepID=UPI0018A10479|nr:NUDIX domain-containing protein [Paenibacillus sp. 1001270B_150601_E10]
MNQYRHLGVYGICVEQGKILLIKKARGPHTGKWDLPGGTIEHGETPEETLCREWEEETGIVGISYSLYSVESYQMEITLASGEEEDLHHLGILYTVNLLHSPMSLKVNGDGEDSLGAEWIDVGALSPECVTPFVYKAIKDIQQQTTGSSL